MSVIRFVVKRIGGPFDGSKGLVWHDDGDQSALPEQLFVGRCPGYGECGIGWCSEAAGGGPHLAAWDAQLTVSAPVPGAAQYTRVDAVVESLGFGEATYVHAELDLRPFCETPPEFAGIGADDVYGPGLTWGAMVLAMQERHVRMVRAWHDYLRRL